MSFRIIRIKHREACRAHICRVPKSCPLHASFTSKTVAVISGGDLSDAALYLGACGVSYLEFIKAQLTACCEPTSAQFLITIQPHSLRLQHELQVYRRANSLNIRPVQFRKHMQCAKIQSASRN